MQRRIIWVLVLVFGIISFGDIWWNGLGHAMLRIGDAFNVQLEDPTFTPDFGFQSPGDSVDILSVQVTVDDPSLIISWDSVEGASYYRVSMRPRRSPGFSGLDFLPIVERTTATTVEIPVEWVRWSYWSSEWEEGRLYKASLLGRRPTLTTLQVQVSAFASDDTLLATNYYEERRGMMLMRSWYSHEEFRERAVPPVSEEERLIDNNQYSEALLGFRHRLERNPFDEEALHVLFRAHYFGIDRTGHLKDAAMAFHFGERLLALLPPGPVRDGYVERVAEVAAELGLVWQDDAEVAE